MSPDLDLGIRMQLLAIGMQAKSGRVDEADLNTLNFKAATELEDGSPAARMVAKFADDFQAARHDPDLMAQLGQALVDDVERMNRVDPPDLHRKDIHG